MTLHEAIEIVLVDAQTPLTPEQIASLLKEKELYTRKDGTLVTPSQVSARVNNYKDIFTVDKTGRIFVTDRTGKVFSNIHGYLYNLFTYAFSDPKEVYLLSFTSIFIASKLSVEQIDRLNGVNQLLDAYNSILPINIQALPEYEIVKSLISRLDKHHIAELRYIFAQFAHEMIGTEKFGEYFESALIKNSIEDYSLSGYFSTPLPIAKFIGSFFDLTPGGQIFDPYAGFGSSGIEAYNRNRLKSPKLIAGDVNSTACFMGTLNLLANNCENSFYVLGGAYSGWDEHMKADLLVTNPPFNAKVPVAAFMNRPHVEDYFRDIYRGDFNYNMDSHIASVLFALAHLNNRGKGILVIPEVMAFSSRKDYNTLRRYLVENRYVSGVVLLPIGAYKPFSNVPTIALIIDKSSNRDELFLYDASAESNDFFENNYSQITKSYHDHEAIEGKSKWIGFESISQDTYDLSPKRFLVKSLDGEGYKAIRDVAKNIRTGTVIPKTNLNRKAGIPFIQVGNLIDGEGLNEIDNSIADYYISEIDEVSRNPNFLSPNSVLISKVGSKLKATIYRGQGGILCNPNIIVIELNEQIITPEYLITQLQSAYVLDQIDTIRHNIGVPHFSKGDFLGVKIKMLPVADQADFVAKFYGKRLKEEAVQSERQLDDELYNIIAALKHELNQPISSIGMDVPTLYEFLDSKISSQALISWSEPIVELLPGQQLTENDDIILKNVLKRIIASAEKAKSTLQKAEQTLNIGRGVFSPETINLKQMLMNDILPHYHNSNCVIHVKGGDVLLMGDKYQLEMLFNRLIENAIKHGFDEKTPKNNNIINIRLKEKSAGKQFHEIIVENNGAPFPHGFNLFKFQTSGHTSNRRNGSGFGGFHIKRIIENHKGELRIADSSEQPHSEYKVKFEIYLP